MEQKNLGRRFNQESGMQQQLLWNTVIRPNFRLIREAQPAPRLLLFILVAPDREVGYRDLIFDGQ